MEDDIDIYADLPSFETKDCQANKELTEECSKLKEENTKLKEDVSTLGANMSSLMKTAKAEIARKDRMIAQLRQELDNAAFRRGNYGGWKKRNTNNPKVKKSEQNTEKTQQTPLVKEEVLQENAATEMDDISDVEDMEDTKHPVPTDQQDKLTSTVFGARLKNKLLLEQEAERVKKEEARIDLLAVPVKVEAVGDTELASGNIIAEKEEPKVASPDTSNVLTEEIEIPVVSSVPLSNTRISQLYPEELYNPCHRQAPKRRLSEKRDFSAISEPKRRRVEEERYWRQEDARPYHNGNFKYDDVHYNSDGYENSDYSKSSTKYTDSRRTAHNRNDYDRAHYKVRGGRSKPTYRSNGIGPRYNARHPGRYRMEESRGRYDKYERRQEDGWSKKGDDQWSECTRQINELREQIEGKVGGRSDYNSYKGHHQLEWNLKKLGRKSRSPESHRSHSGSRGSREKEFDKRRSKRSRSTDKFMNAKSTVDERESSKERQIRRVKNSKDCEVEVGKSRDAQSEVPPDLSRNDPPSKAAINKISSEIAENGSLACTERPSHVDSENTKPAKATQEKLVSQVENDSEVASMQSAIPEIAAPEAASFREEKQREDGWSREGDNNWFEYSREIDELRKKIESEIGGRSEYNNYNSHNQLDSNLKRLGCKSRSPEKYKSRSDSQKSRDKKFDKQRSKRSRSTDKCITAKSTVDERDDKERQSSRSKDSKDIEVVKNSPDTLPEIPTDFSKNDPPKKEAVDEISSSEIVENGVPLCKERPDHVDIESAESAALNLEKLPSQVETSDERIAAVETDLEVALIQSAMAEPAALGSRSSREEKRPEVDNNYIEDGKESDELCDKFESNIGGSCECNNYKSLKKLEYKSRTPEKNRRHGDGRRSREKEVDKRRSKRSSSTDKCINAKSTVDERESGKKRQSRRAKDSKDIEVEVKNSRDAQPEVPPDFSRDDPSKEVAIDKISSSEIAENGLPVCTEGQGHVDVENAASVRVTLEKLVSQVETLDRGIAALENDSEAASIQLAMPEPATLGSGSSREEKRREGDDNGIDYSGEIDEQRDKFESNIGGTSEHNNYKSLKRLGCKSRSPEKDKSHIGGRRSKEKELDKRRSKRSKRSRSTDKFVNAKSTVDEQESGQERQSTRAEDSKDLEVEVRNSRDPQPEVALDFSKNSPPNELVIDKISSTEIAKNGLPLSTEEPNDVDIDRVESARETLEKIVSQVETSDRWIADLENDSEVASIESAIPEAVPLGSGSFREEKIENIEKFIKDYQENEEPCPPTANREAEERGKLGDSTSSIVDALSMDIEESAADEKSDNVSKNPPEESRTDIKDVAGDTESTISKPDMPANECTSSVQLKTPDDKKISVTPEISDKKVDAGKHVMDKVAILKLTKYRPRIPCATIVARYSRRKQSVLADSGSSKCVAKSQSSTNTEGDKSKNEIKTRQIPTKEPSGQSSESSAKKSDSKIFIPKKQIEDANILTGKNIDAAAPEKKNTTEDSRAREEADCRVEKTENNSVSVSSSRNNILHQAGTSPELPAKADAALKLNNVQEPVELRETRLAQKTTLVVVPSIDSRLSKRKTALPKEVDGRAKPAKQCIIVTTRRRRPLQLKDTSVAKTLILSVDDVNLNESVKTDWAKAESPEFPKFVSEPAIRGRKRRLIDK